MSDDWDSLYNIRAVSEGDQVDIASLLFPFGSGYLEKNVPGNRFLQRNNGDSVPVEVLEGKIVGLYFADASNSVCQSFTPLLVQACNDLSANGNIEIVFLSCDGDVPSSEQHFSTMPSSWLAFPFYENIYKLMQQLAVICLPHLVIFSENGQVLALNGFQIISDYGSSAFPFSGEKIQSFIDEEKRKQTIGSILATKTRDYLISSDRSTVPVSDLEGKTVGIYFWSYSSSVFTRTLAQVYNELKEKGELFEIVMIMPLMERDYAFDEAIGGMPWLAVPLNDTKCTSLFRYFGFSTTPYLTIIGPDGQTLNPNVVQAVRNYESLAFPFTPERIVELEEIQRALEESQTLQSLFVSGDRDFLIDKNGSQITVSSLEGKTVVLFFSEISCNDLSMEAYLKEAYRELKAKEAEFEVIFVSTEKDESYFEMFIEEMPWLALPFGDERAVELREYFKVRELPMIVVIGPTGRTVAKDARKVVMKFGAYGYPFTEERGKEIEDESEEQRKGWLEKVCNTTHICHEIHLSYWEKYTCDCCKEEGESWSYNCSECNFFLHPNCALSKEHGYVP